MNDVNSHGFWRKATDRTGRKQKRCGSAFAALSRSFWKSPEAGVRREPGSRHSNDGQMIARLVPNRCVPASGNSCDANLTDGGDKE